MKTKTKKKPFTFINSRLGGVETLLIVRSKDSDDKIAEILNTVLDDMGVKYLMFSESLVALKLGKEEYTRAATLDFEKLAENITYRDIDPLWGKPFLGINPAFVSAQEENSNKVTFKWPWKKDHTQN